MAGSLLTEALVRWQHAAGPFWPYVCAAPFLGTEEGEALAWQAASTSGRRSAGWTRRETDLADHLLDAARLPESLGGESLPTILLVDLPPEPVLAAAPLLAERGWYIVPVVQRWIASPAVLPCRRLVERLMIGSRQARRPTSPRGAVLIADGERTGPIGYPGTVSGRAFDNRYEYQVCRFPSMDFLKAQGVGRVQWITSSASPAERSVKPDLAPYLEELLRAGLAADVVPWPIPS